MKSFKFTIEGNEFISAVAAAAFALNKRDKNAKIGLRMYDGGLMVEAGNSYFSVSRFIILKNDDCPCFNFSLPLKEVLNLCKSVKNHVVTFDYSAESGSVSVFFGGAELKIRVFENETKVKNSNLTGEPDYRGEWICSKKGVNGFVDALNNVSYAQAKNDVRYYLCGVNLSCKDGRLRLAATDGNRAATQNVGNTVCHDFSATLHFDTVSLLQKQAKKSVITIKVYASRYDTSLIICFDGVTIAADTKEMGKFPDLDRPAYLAKTDGYIELYKSDLLNALKTLCNSKGFCPAGISIDEDNALLTLSTKHGSISVPASVSGISRGDVGGVNLPYLYDVLLNCDHDFLRLYCNQESNIYKIESTEQTHIVAGCKV